MASLDASSSLGAAIGLTGTPKDYSMDFLRAGQAQQKIAQTAKKNAAADEAKAMKAFQVKPGKYLPSRTELVKRTGAEMYEAIREAQRRGSDPSTDTEVLKKAYDTQVKLKGLELEYNDYIADQQMFEKDPKNHKLNEDITSIYAGDLQIDENVQPYKKGAAVGFTGDIVQYLMKAGQEVGESVDITKYTDNGTLRTEEYLKVLDEKNKALAKDIYSKALAGSNRYGQVLLDEVKGELADKITYQNASDEQKAQMETDLFLTKAENTIKIPQREKISTSRIQDKEIQKKEWSVSRGGGSMENDRWRVVKSINKKPDGTVTTVDDGKGGKRNARVYVYETIKENDVPIKSYPVFMVNSAGIRTDEKRYVDARLAKQVEVAPNVFETYVIQPVFVQGPNGEKKLTGWSKPMQVVGQEGADMAAAQTGINLDMLTRNLPAEEVRRMSGNTSTKTIPKTAAPKTEKAAAKENKMTPAQWNEAWSKLPKGKTMVGLDGKTYKK